MGEFRSKSLRERTGVDQRLERLPSGPQPGLRHASSLPWTVLRAGVQPDRNRPVQISDFIGRRIEIFRKFLN